MTFIRNHFISQNLERLGKKCIQRTSVQTFFDLLQQKFQPSDDPEVSGFILFGAGLYRL